MRRLLRDGDWRCGSPTSARRPTGCARRAEIHTGDLRDLDEARRALDGCDRVVHLAAIVGGIANFHKLPYTLLETNNALYNALFRAAIEREVERFVYVSSSMVFERAQEFPTTRGLARPHVPRRAPRTASRSWRASTTAAPPHDEFGLRFSIVRPFNAYGPGEMPGDEPGIAHIVPDLIERALRRERPFPIFGSGEQTRTLTHVDDIADGIVAALTHDAALGEDFNVSADEELTVREIAADRVGGVRQRSRRARARAPAVVRGGRAAPLALDREGARGARLGGAHRRARGHRRHRRVVPPRAV